MATPPRVLIDLNIILDVLQPREPFYPASAGVLAAAERGQIRASISAHRDSGLPFLSTKKVKDVEEMVFLDWYFDCSRKRVLDSQYLAPRARK